MNLRRIAPMTYVMGEWNVWGGVGRASNSVTWHVTRNGAWLISFPKFQQARQFVLKAATEGQTS